jgi:hypothetical protein
MIEANVLQVAAAAALVCCVNVVFFARSSNGITKSSYHHPPGNRNKSIQRNLQPDMIESKLKSLLFSETETNRPRGLKPLKHENGDIIETLSSQEDDHLSNNITISSSSTLPPNHRFMAMINIQEPCPTPQQWNQYTDIMLSYTTTLQEDGTCSESCEINTTLTVCNNQPNHDLLEEWKLAGKRVWLVVGGPTMGRDSYYDLVTPACWEFCFGRQLQLVEGIASLVNDTQHIQGVVISYQYLYEDNQNDSGFLRGNEAQALVRTLTTGLRERLDDGMLLGHMPVDSSIVVGTDYYTLMSELAQNNQFDLLLPQYFNGVARPVSNTQEVLQHLDILATFMFLGDASRIVFGMCNNDGDEFYCGGSDYAVDSVEGASIMKSLSSMYPCHGGAFFWSASSDPSGFWSIPLLAEYTPALEVDACLTNDEQNVNDNKGNETGCISPLTALSCDDCVRNGCSWCMVDGKSICQPKQGNGTECLEVCLPEEPEEDLILGPDSLIQHHIMLQGLSQEYFGITSLPVESVRSLEELHASHVESFFSSKIDPNLLLDSNITVIEVIIPTMFSRSLRRTNDSLLSQRRQMQHDGSSVVVVYDQNVSYWYPVVQQMLSPETLSMVPFATNSARDDLISMLQASSDPILEQVLGVSEITVTPQPPTESPVVPPISTLAPVTMVPTVSTTPPPTQLPQISPTQTPVVLPIGNGTSGGPNPSSPANNGPPSSPPNSSPMNQPTTAAAPPPSPPVINTPTGLPTTIAPPIPEFITDPPNPLQPLPLQPPPSVAPTNSPPTASPAPPTNLTSATNPNNNATSDEYPIFGKYTGFIVIGIVFGGLLLVFTIHMKYCMGEYVDA